MSWLLDVNFLLASRWTSHSDHVSVRDWLDQQIEFHTTAIVELGFMRVSMSPGYAVPWRDAYRSLAKLLSRPSHRFINDDLSALDSPETVSKDTTDAHLVRLAIRHGLKLATLDTSLIAKPWAIGHALNPLIKTP